MEKCRTFKKRETTFRTEKIGVIEVDTGQLVISDPSRLGEILDNDIPCEEESGLTGQFFGQAGRPFAILSQTGFGDGKFPVYAEIAHDPKYGDSVIALHIHLYPIYSLPGDGKEIEELEREYMAEMNQ
jgi:hypothetical protein